MDGYPIDLSQSGLISRGRFNPLNSGNSAYPVKNIPILTSTMMLDNY